MLFFRKTTVTIHMKRGPCSASFDGNEVRHLRSNTLSAAHILKTTLGMGDISEEKREQLFLKQPKTKQTKGVRMHVEDSITMLRRVVAPFEAAGIFSICLFLTNVVCSTHAM